MKELFIFIGIVAIISIIMILITAIVIGAKSDEHMDKIFKEKDKK